MEDVPVDVLGEVVNGHIALDMILEFVEFDGPLVEHLLKRVVLLDEFQLLVLAHLLDLNALNVHVVGLLETAGVSHHGFADHVASLQFLEHGSVIVLEAVFSEFLLHFYLLDRLAKEGQLCAVEIFVAFVGDIA